MRRIPVRRFAVILSALVAGTLVTELWLVRSGLGGLALWVVLVAGILGIACVALIGQPEEGAPREGSPVPTALTAPPAEDDEPFDDPVEAADREESGAAPTPALEDAAVDPSDDGLE